MGQIEKTAVRSTDMESVLNLNLNYEKISFRSYSDILVQLDWPDAVVARQTNSCPSQSLSNTTPLHTN